MDKKESKCCNNNMENKKETLYCSVAAAIVGCSTTKNTILDKNCKKIDEKEVKFKNNIKKEFEFLKQVFNQENNTKCVLELIERNELTIEILIKSSYPNFFIFTVNRKTKNSNIQYVNQIIESNIPHTITVLEEPNLSFKIYQQDYVNNYESNLNKTIYKSTKLFKKLTRHIDKNGLCLNIDLKSFKLNKLHNFILDGINGTSDIKIRRKNCFGYDEVIFGMEELKDVIDKILIYVFNVYKNNDSMEEFKCNLTIANFILQCITEYYGIIPLTMRLLVLAKMFDLQFNCDFMDIRETILRYNCEIIKGACLLTTPKALKSLSILGQSIINYFNSFIELYGYSFFFPPESETPRLIEFKKWTKLITIILKVKIWDNPVAGVYIIKLQNIIKELIEKNILEWFSKKLITIDNQLTYLDYICSIIDQLYLYISSNHQYLTEIFDLFQLNYINTIFKIINDRLNIILRSSISNAVNELNNKNHNELEIFTRSTMKLFDALRQLKVLQTNLNCTNVIMYEEYFEATSVFWTFTWKNMSKQLIYKTLEPQHNERRKHSDSITSVISLKSNKNFDYPCFDSAIYCLAIWKALSDDYVRLQISNPRIARICSLRIICVFAENLRLYTKEICKEAKIKNSAIFFLKSANSIEHVVEQITQNYPRFIEIERLKVLLSDEEYFTVCNTMSKIITTTQNICYKMGEDLILLFITKKKDTLKNLCKNLSNQGVKGEKKNLKTLVKNFLNQEGIENLIYYINNIYNLFEKNLSTRLCEFGCIELWGIIECYIKDFLIMGQSVKYYEQMEVACYHVCQNLKVIWNTQKSQLYKELKINQISTEDLILQYYSRLGDRTIDTPIYNQTQTLTLRIGYVPMSGQQILLSMLIIRANNVPILDTFSKSSDPYVRIELMPRYYFPLYSYPPLTTEIRQKTLNPRWNQMFQMSIAERKFFVNGACLRISILDHDVVLFNDIAGEAFIPLSTISKMSGSGIKDLPKQIIIPILPVSYNQYGIEFMILKDRSNQDKEAKEFCDYELYIKNYHMLPPTSNDDKEFRIEAIKTFDKRKNQIKTVIKNVF